MSDGWNRELGRVEGVQLVVEDHGCLTVYLHLNFGGTGQGFGGYALDEWSNEKDRRVGTAAGLDFILRLLNLFKVTGLDRIKGRTVYALRSKHLGQIEGLEMPAFDGGAKFVVEDWRREWFGKAPNCTRSGAATGPDAAQPNAERP
jgi:hypothetical protein